MARFYLPPQDRQSPTWELRGDEAHHAARVMRLRVGDECVVFDGVGHANRAVVASPPTDDSVLLTPGESCSLPAFRVNLTLFQAIPKGSNMDWIIQKAVELGVNRIVPLMTERTIVRLNDKEARAKQSKWQRTALEACKQCGQNTLPVVETPVTFKQCFTRSFAPGMHLLASLLPEARPVRDVLEAANAPTMASLLVGPEGDFTPEESREAMAAGFLPVSYGSLVLRVETATFYGLSVVRYALG